MTMNTRYVYRRKMFTCTLNIETRRYVCEICWTIWHTLSVSPLYTYYLMSIDILSYACIKCFFISGLRMENLCLTRPTFILWADQKKKLKLIKLAKVIILFNFLASSHIDEINHQLGNFMYWWNYGALSTWNSSNVC